MNDARIAKLRAQAEHLLDLFIALRQKYAMLHPLAFDAELVKRIGPQGRGHAILKNTLLSACVLDLVKLALDRDKRTPSASNLMTALEVPEILARFWEDYAPVPTIAPSGADGASVPDSVLAEIQAADRHDRSTEFHEIRTTLCMNWCGLIHGERLPRFKKWRDKLIAHSELHHAGSEYHPMDLEALGLKWRDLGEAIAEFQQVVEGINLLVRSAGFAWDVLDEQLGTASKGFWALVGEAPGARR